MAIWSLGMLYPLVLSSLPLPEDLTAAFSLNLGPDWRVFGFTLLVAAVAGITAGLVPALQSSNPDLTAALKDEGSTFGGNLSQSRLRSALVVAQVAVCLTLLVGAGLLIKNQRRLQTFDTGMVTRNVFSIAVGLTASSAESRDGKREADLRGELAERLRAVPGVVAVTQAHRQPLSGGMGRTLVTLPGEASYRPHEARFNFVSAEYFEALSIPLLRGRSFTAQEVKANLPVIVISEATARRYWPDADPLGKSIGIPLTQESQRNSSGNQEQTSPTYQQYGVIGVARDNVAGTCGNRTKHFSTCH
jgi:hypothetical protein